MATLRATTEMQGSRAIASALLLFASLALASCHVEHGAPPRPELAQSGKTWREPRKKIDPLTGKLVREWTVLREPGKAPVPDGKEITYYLNGAKKSETEYVKGRKVGLRRSWYENGQLSSESFFGDAQVEHPQTFWYPNGQRRMQGPALDGARNGVWHIWYRNGQLAEQGEFKQSLREGVWLTFDEAGQPSGERKYKKNVRISGPPLPAEHQGGALEAALPRHDREVHVDPADPAQEPELFEAEPSAPQPKSQPAPAPLPVDPDPDPDRDRPEDGDPICVPH